MRHRTLLAAAALLTVAGSLPGVSSPSAAVPPEAIAAAAGRLPTGALLDPAGGSFDLGNMPLAMALAPEGDRVVVLLAGWREQGIQVVETRSGRVLPTLELAAAFLGLAFSADGHRSEERRVG